MPHPLLLLLFPANFALAAVLQLTFRTYNKDFGNPNHNDDDLAQDLRDTLMPARGRLHRNRSPLLKFKTGLLDTPYFGIPGIVNFIDVRTQWFDSAVKRAIADGITQVGGSCVG
jgi:O-methyltransferase involved in polyketide biosynthesis